MPTMELPTQSPKKPKVKASEAETIVRKPGAAQRPDDFKTKKLSGFIEPPEQPANDQASELSDVRRSIEQLHTSQGIVLASGSEHNQSSEDDFAQWLNRSDSQDDVVADFAPGQEKMDRETRRPVLMKEIAAIDAKPEYQGSDETAIAARKKAFTDLVRLSADALQVPQAMAEQFGDRWLMVGYLSRGGMGTVFEAYDLHLRKPAVLKFFMNQTGREDQHMLDLLDRFRREAQSMAKISTHHVVRVFEADFLVEGAWYAMEKVDGGSLKDQIEQRGAFRVREAVEAATHIAKGLKAAESRGIVHRDLKPDNVLYDPVDRVYKLADFGLAKSIETQNLKLRWVESLLRDIVTGKDTQEWQNLDEKSSQRLKSLAAEIQMEDLSDALARGSSAIEAANPDLFDEMTRLASDISDYSVTAGFNRVLDSYRSDRLKWVGEQVKTYITTGKIARYHGRPISDTAKQGIVQLANELRTDEKVLSLMTAGKELPLENVAHQVHAEQIAESLPDPDPKLTEAGSILGTPAYMSPEQWAGQKTTEQSDVWSFGVMFYQMLTTKMPFDGATPGELAAQVWNKQVTSIRTIRQDLPQALADLIDRMLSKKPENRPTIDEILQVLESPAASNREPIRFSSDSSAPVNPRLKKMGSGSESVVASPYAETVIKKKPGFLEKLINRVRGK